MSKMFHILDTLFFIRMQADAAAVDLSHVCWSDLCGYSIIFGVLGGHVGAILCSPWGWNHFVYYNSCKTPYFPLGLLSYTYSCSQKRKKRHLLWKMNRHVCCLNSGFDHKWLTVLLIHNKHSNSYSWHSLWGCLVLRGQIDSGLISSQVQGPSGLLILSRWPVIEEMCRWCRRWNKSTECPISAVAMQPCPAPTGTHSREPLTTFQRNLFWGFFFHGMDGRFCYLLDI